MSCHRLFILFMLMLLAITACVPAPTPTPALPAIVPTVQPAPTAAPSPTLAPLVKVKLGEAQRTPLFLAHYVALAKGYFKEEGLDVELTDFGAGSRARTALIAKEVDFAANSFVHLPLARAANAPLKAVAAYNVSEGFSIVVRTDLKDSVKSIADLKGKTIGITSPGSGSWALTVTYLKKSGLDPDKDVKLVALNTASAMYAALKSKQVDALGSFEPIDTLAESEQTGFHLVDIYDPKQHAQWLGGDTALSFFLLTREDVIASKPDQVQRMVNGINKGLKFIASNNADDLAKTVASYFSEMDVKLLSATIAHMKLSFPPTVALSEKAYATDAKVYLDTAVIKENLPFSQGVDTTFAGKAP